jgi:branched-chain amino acid transport system substrate-binding protein
LNAKGGVLGEPVEMTIADDYCDGEQGVAAANKLVADSVVFVVGHICSGASIPASKVYADAGILMISPGSTNPTLTEQGFRNVFRVIGRDDLQGAMAGNYPADRWADHKIAIIHDGELYGQGLAEETKRQLNQRGVREALFVEIEPGEVDYADVVEEMRALGADVLYYAGYSAEAGLIIRQARDRGYDLQLIGGDGIATEDFGLIAGAASDGTLMTNIADAHSSPTAAPLVAALRAEGPEPASDAILSYAAVQVWAQAVEMAGTFDVNAVAEELREHEFDTVLGRISFDAKGDVTGYEPFVWYVWKGGDYAPIDPAEPAE